MATTPTPIVVQTIPTIVMVVHKLTIQFPVATLMTRKASTKQMLTPVTAFLTRERCVASHIQEYRVVW